MAALNALSSGTGLEFAKLKKLTGATDGNLGAHSETLAKAGYVAAEKAFVGKKPQTTVTATAAGGVCTARGDVAGDHRREAGLIGRSCHEPLPYPGEGESIALSASGAG